MDACCQPPFGASERLPLSGSSHVDVAPAAGTCHGLLACGPNCRQPSLFDSLSCATTWQVLWFVMTCVGGVHVLAAPDSGRLTESSALRASPDRCWGLFRSKVPSALVPFEVEPLSRAQHCSCAVGGGQVLRQCSLIHASIAIVCCSAAIL